jgi:hypothetical protein
MTDVTRILAAVAGRAAPSPRNNSGVVGSVE